MKMRRFLGWALVFTLVMSSRTADASNLAGRPHGPSAPVDVGDQITQFGITWTFEHDYVYGQFANGDYWVVGPVTIVAIDPPSTDAGGRVMNGSMVNPSPADGSVQGYDSAMYGAYGPHFDAALNVARPNGQDLSAGNRLTVQPGSSLVSTISLAEAGARPQLQTAAVLTVLDSPAPSGSFRPPYSGADKTIEFNVSQIDASLLAQLPPVASTPAISTVEGYFERPWIDHVPNWLADYHHPEENMPSYGREMSAQVGAGALMLHLDLPYAHKEALLIRYIQLGIDLYGVVQDGGESNWTPNGGHTTGRKWPILFAGLMLGDEQMKNVGPGDGSGAVLFSEDAQTFYVSQADIDMTQDPDLRGCYLTEYEQSDLGLPEWGIRHATEPDQDNKAWCAIYRRCCTANSWAGFVLAAHIMDAQDLWAHDPLFDYQDRYMAIETPGDWTRSWDDFTEEMWDTYRAHYGPVWPEEALELYASPGDETIYLRWDVHTTLPVTTTWRVDYYTQTVSVYTATEPLSTTRSTELTQNVHNYEWYTVTLSAVGITPPLTDAVRVMPTDISVHLPIVMQED